MTADRTWLRTLIQVVDNPMFTVKATYRGEIRKISFNDLSFFPSFDQLHNHVSP
jgi:hypothetical protein